ARSVSDFEDVNPFTPLHREWLNNVARVKELGGPSTMPGEHAFTMWETYGFPLELTQEFCAKFYIDVNVKAFDAKLDEARVRSRAGSTMSKEIFESGPVAELKKQFAGKPTLFKGYDTLSVPGAKVLAIAQNNELKTDATSGEAIVLLDRTSF